MHSTGRTTVGESSTGNAMRDGLLTISQPTIVTRRDNSIQPEGLRTVSQLTCDNNNILSRSTSNGSLQTRGKINAGVVDASLNSAAIPVDCLSLVKNAKSIPSQDVAVVAALKVLHEKQCTSERILCGGEGAAAESLAGYPCSSPARSAVEGLSCCDDDAGVRSPPSARLFSDLENENPRSPARIRRDEFSRHSLDSIPTTPRAPMKPTRVKSLNTLFPGRTRRRLDFDHL